jgi:hypothetical protein
MGPFNAAFDVRVNWVIRVSKLTEDAAFSETWRLDGLCG